jgi:hypothetical protein
VIAAQQVPSALGVARPDVENAVAAAASAVARFAARPDWTVLGLVVLAVVLTAALPRVHRSLPAGLLAVAGVTLVVEFSGADVARTGSLPSSLPLRALPDLGGAPDLVGAAAVVGDLHRRGVTVLGKGAGGEHRRLLAAVGTLAPLAERGHVFATLPEAVAHVADSSDRDVAPVMRAHAHRVEDSGLVVVGHASPERSASHRKDEL